MQIDVVTKRDGTEEPYNYEKIQRQIQYACDGIDHVSQSMIELNMNLELYNKIPTKVLDQVTEKSAVKLITSTEGHSNYQYVAGRLLNSSLRKEIYGAFEPWRLYDVVVRNVEAGMYTPDLLEWFTEDEWDLMDSFIDHTKDERMSHAALSQFVDKYLVKNKSTKKLYETPQVRYMVSAATLFHAEPKNRMKFINDYYQKASSGEFTLATPVLAGLGTCTKQFSSCVLIKADDTLDSIFAAGEMMAKYASKRAGIGLEVGRVRRQGAPIRNGEIAHTGLVPFIKKWFADLRSCSQGGLRNASATITYPMWHYDYEDLIVLKNNQGTEETRARHLDYSVVTCKYLWRRFKNRQPMSFFDPNDVPDMYEAFYRDQDEFVRLYEMYEKDPSIVKKTMNAEDAFRQGLLNERSDTGRIYMVFIDNVINQGPVDSKLFPIYQSNLCQEILLPTSPFQTLADEAGRIALCTLSSENWGKFKKPQDMRSSLHLAVRALSNVLSYQDFLSVQSAASNQEFRPLGIGVTNLAYWHAKRGLRYGSPEALAEVKRWMEHQSYYLLEATVQLAKERGACTMSEHTCYQKGIFPWEMRADGVNELTDFTPELDWEPLREEAKKYGVHNGFLGAIAPVESSSVVIDSTNGIEMPKDLISVKESKASSLVQVVPEYNKLKDKYQLMWDQTDCIDYLKTAAVMAAYIDQSISTNTFYNPAHFENRKIPATMVARNLMLAQHWGIKTMYYSLIKKTGAAVNTEEAAQQADLPVTIIDDEEHCESCVL